MPKQQVSKSRSFAVVCLYLIAAVDHVSATDRISEPPAREAFSSPGRCYELVISMLGEAEEWMSSGSRGELFRIEGGERNSQWTMDLPHAYRPRFAFVDDAGVVVLLDQWINVAGPHAVTVLDQDGATVAAYDFYDIAEAIDVPGREIVPLAKHGSWMSTVPQFDSENNAVRVMVARRQLLVHFGDGSLTASSH